MKPKLNSISLFWQCTILFALFVCGQAIFWSIICLRISQAETAVNKQAHFNEILRHSQTTATSLSDYEFAIGAWVRAYNGESDLPTARAKLDGHKKEMADAVAWLDKNLSDYPQLKEQEEEIATGQKRMFRLVHRILEKAESMDNKLAGTQLLIAFYNRTNNERMKWQAQIVQLLKDETEIFDKIPSKNAERRELVSQSIIGSLAFNAAFAFMFVWFLKMLKDRTLILVENTKRYLGRQDFLAPIDGDDEIAAVDTSMHKMRESIETAQKERQAFLAVVSHELRTPLASILSSLEITLELSKLSDDSRAKLVMSESELRRFLSLINDLLDLEKLESGKLKMIKKSVYLETLIERAMAQVATAKPDSEVKIMFDVETDAELNADPERLAQAIGNLLLNAVEASPVGKNVRIAVHEKPGEVRVEILDEGPGVSKDLAANLFERFRKSNGEIITGMGLPTAKLIVEAHDGRIGYTAGEGGGSIFWIELGTISTD